jgi:hypothetical protein
LRLNCCSRPWARASFRSAIFCSTRRIPDRYGVAEVGNNKREAYGCVIRDKMSRLSVSGIRQSGE